MKNAHVEMANNSEFGVNNEVEVKVQISLIDTITTKYQRIYKKFGFSRRFF